MSVFQSMDLIQITHSPGYREKGRWVEGELVPNPFKGTAQPAPGKAMELLPDGKRNSETILVFAPKEMSFTAADPEKKVSGDIIVWEGQKYEVQVVRPWKGPLIPHWELLSTRVKEGET